MRQVGLTSDPKTMIGIALFSLLAIMLMILYVQFETYSIYNQLLGTVTSLATIITYSVGLVLPLIAFTKFTYNQEAGRYVSPFSGRFITSSIAYITAIFLVIMWYFMGIPILQKQITSGLYGILQPSVGGIFAYIGTGIFTLVLIVPAMILLAMPNPRMIFGSITRR